MNSALIGIVCGGLFILVFFIGGVSAVIFGIRNRKKAQESTGWPSVDGVITKTWTNESRDTDEDGFTSYSYTPKWQYQYQLGGQTYSSEQVTFGGEKSYSNRKKAEQELIKYPQNGRVRVYYNPQDPADSVLVRGTKGTLGAIIAGIVLILISLCGACVGGYSLISNM